MKCEKCGLEIKENDAFCENCGAEVKAKAEKKESGAPVTQHEQTHEKPIAAQKVPAWQIIVAVIIALIGLGMVILVIAESIYLNSFPTGEFLPIKHVVLLELKYFILIAGIIILGFGAAFLLKFFIKKSKSKPLTMAIMILLPFIIIGLGVVLPKFILFSPERKIVGYWIKDSDITATSAGMQIKNDGTGLMYVVGKKGEMTWKFKDVSKEGFHYYDFEIVSINVKEMLVVAYEKNDKTKKFDKIALLTNSEQPPGMLFRQKGKSEWDKFLANKSASSPQTTQTTKATEYTYSTTQTPSTQEPQTDNLEQLVLEGQSRFYTDADLIGKSKYELSILRNGMYALSGRQFTSNTEVIDFFSKCTWYQPDTVDDGVVQSRMNEYQKENVKKIRQYE